MNPMKKQLGRLLKKGEKALFNTLDKALMPNSPEHPARDPEVQILQLLTCEYQELFPKYLPPDLSKAQLRNYAEVAFRKNENRLRKVQAEDDFAGLLHSNMLRDSGLLGVMNTMLQAAENDEPVRWEVYRGYACRQLEQLEQARNVSPSAPEPIAQLSAEELAARIRGQMNRLAARRQSTEYLPLYESLRKISFASPQEDLTRWHREASAIVGEGMARLTPELRQALREDYPHL